MRQCKIIEDLEAATLLVGKTGRGDLKRDQEQEKASTAVQAWVWGVAVSRKCKVPSGSFSIMMQKPSVAGGRTSKPFAAKTQKKKHCGCGEGTWKSSFPWRKIEKDAITGEVPCQLPGTQGPPNIEARLGQWKPAPFPYQATKH